MMRYTRRLESWQEASHPVSGPAFSWPDTPVAPEGRPAMSDFDTYDADESFCRGDDLTIDWSRVGELPARMARVVDEGSALEFYDELAGHEAADG